MNNLSAAQANPVWAVNPARKLPRLLAARHREKPDKQQPVRVLPLAVDRAGNKPQASQRAASRVARQVARVVPMAEAPLAAAVTVAQRECPPAVVVARSPPLSKWPCSMHSWKKAPASLMQ